MTLRGTHEEVRAKQLVYEARYRAAHKDDPEWKARKYAQSKIYRDRNLQRGRDRNRATKLAWRANKPWMFTWSASRRRSYIYGLEFTLTREWCEAQWLKGSALSGTQFSSEAGSPFAPSIDRIDSSKGYTVENSRMILFAENLFKNEWTDEVVVTIARAIVARHSQ